MRGGKTNFFSSHGHPQQKVGKSQHFSDGFPSDFLSKWQKSTAVGEGTWTWLCAWRIGLIELAIKVLNDQ